MIRTPEGPKTMPKFTKLAVIIAIRRLVRNERGATSIEYAMIASGVAVVLAATITGLGTNVKGLFTSVSTALK